MSLHVQDIPHLSHHKATAVNTHFSKTSLYSSGLFHPAFSFQPLFESSFFFMFCVTETINPCKNFIISYSLHITATKREDREHYSQLFGLSTLTRRRNGWWTGGASAPVNGCLLELNLPLLDFQGTKCSLKCSAHVLPVQRCFWLDPSLLPRYPWSVSVY